MWLNSPSCPRSQISIEWRVSLKFGMLIEELIAIIAGDLVITRPRASGGIVALEIELRSVLERQHAFTVSMTFKVHL